MRPVISTLLLLGLRSLPAGAQAPLPIPNQVTILMKVLSYDARLMKTDDSEIHIGVLFCPEDLKSNACASDFATQIEKFKGRTIHGKGVACVPLPVPGGSEAKSVLASTHFDALYVAPGCDRLLDQVVRCTRESKTLSMSGQEGYAERGVSVSVIARAEQAGIVINVTASREEGREWDPILLRLCTLVR